MAKKRRKWPKMVAMVLVAAVLTVSVALVLVEKFAPDQTYIPHTIVSLPSRIVAAVVKPMQSAFAWGTQSISGYLEKLKLSKTIEIEYNKLKAQNDELMYRALLAEELEAERDRLEALWEVSQEYMEMNPIKAKVTARETSNWFQMFTINIGESNGVKEYMAVINADGLIGYITKTYETTSEVISIIDSRASVAGLIQSSRDQGTIKGTLGIEDEPTCRMYYLPVDLVPRPGDTVVTSGIGMPFPKGITIGVVRESTRYPDQGKQYVVIEPAADFRHIEEVIVLVYEPKTEDMPEADDGQYVFVPPVIDTPRPIPGVGEQISDPELGGAAPPERVTRQPVDAAGVPLEDGTFNYDEASMSHMDALLAEELAWEQEMGIYGGETVETAAPGEAVVSASPTPVFTLGTGVLPTPSPPAQDARQAGGTP